MTGSADATPWKRPESVLVVVHAASGEVLLLRRSDDPAFWQSVTGSLEAGETPIAAARRELREETGIEAEPVDRRTRTRFEIRGVWRARYAPDVTHNVEHVFEVRLDAPRDVMLSPDEHLAFRWVPADEALALASSPTDRAAIRGAVMIDAAPDAALGDSAAPAAGGPAPSP